MATLKNFIRKHSQKNVNCANGELTIKTNDDKVDKKTSNHFGVNDKERRSFQSLPEINSFENYDDFGTKQDDGIEETIKRVRVDGMEAYSISTTCVGKTFWLALIILSSLIMIFELYKSVYDYWASPLVTTFSIDPSSEMDFPQIYICLTSNINQSYVEHHPTAKFEFDTRKNSLFHAFHEMPSNANDNFNLFNDKNLACSKNNTGTDLHQNENDVYTSQMSLGYNVDDLFKTCTFNEFYSKDIPCSSIVRSLFDEDYGKCYLLSLVNIRQKIRGHGLLIGMNISHTQFMKDTCFAPLSTGLRVIVSKSYALSDTNAVLISPGTYNNLDLTAQYFVFQNTKGGSNPQPCMRNNDIQMKYITGNYSRSVCRKDCELDIMAKKCNCIPLIDPYFLKESILTNIKFCTSEQKLKCIKPNVTDSPSAIKEIEECGKKCFQQCNLWRFPMSPTWQPLNPDKFPKDTNVNDLVYLHISHANMEIEHFEQSPSKTIDEMVSDIGGQINLWLGASMVTLIQIPVVIALLLSWAFYGNVQRKRSRRIFSLT